MPGEAIKLPESLESLVGDGAVLFSWTPFMPHRLKLIVTAKDDDGSDKPEYATYRVRLEHEVDRLWFDRLREHHKLLSKIKMYGSVYYWPQTGYCRDAGENHDKEIGPDVGRIRQYIMDAERSAKSERERGFGNQARRGNRQVSTRWRGEPQ